MSVSGVYEFYLVNAQEVAQLDGAAVPAELDVGVQQQVPPQEQEWQTRLSQLPTSSTVVYQGWHKPFLLNGMPTERRASYIFNFITSEKKDKLPASELHEIQEIVRELVEANVLNKQEVVNINITAEKPNYDKWNARNKF